MYVLVVFIIISIIIYITITHKLNFIIYIIITILRTLIHYYYILNYIRLFDYANSCPDTELSSFNTWRADHCFINSTDASFQLTTELELTKYTSSDCNSSHIQSSTVLTEDCIETVHDISTSFAFFDTTNNGASVYYTVSKSKLNTTFLYIF